MSIPDRLNPRGPRKPRTPATTAVCLSEINSTHTPFWQEPNETVARVKILMASYVSKIDFLIKGTERQIALAGVYARVVRDLRTALDEPNTPVKTAAQLEDERRQESLFPAPQKGGRK